MIADWKGRDRRQHARRDVVQPASVILETEDRIEVRSVDVSEGGVRFFSPDVIDVGERIRFSFHGEDGRLAMVLGCILLDEGYCIRCRFDLE